MFKSLVALKREDGQTMAEYGVVLAVITLAIVVALGGPAPALVIAAVLLLTSGGAGFVGYKLLPREAPLDDTKENVEKHARILKEKIA